MNKLILILILVLIAGWFYWFQYRPSQAKQECEKKMKESFKDSHPQITINQLFEFRKTLYEECLHDKGL